MRESNRRRLAFDGREDHKGNSIFRTRGWRVQRVPRACRELQESEKIMKIAVMERAERKGEENST